MKVKEYASEMINKFGCEQAIKQLDYAIDIWEYKKKSPEIHGLDICNQTIIYFNKVKDICKKGIN